MARALRPCPSRRVATVRRAVWDTNHSNDVPARTFLRSRLTLLRSRPPPVELVNTGPDPRRLPAPAQQLDAPAGEHQRAVRGRSLRRLANESLPDDPDDRPLDHDDAD